jgi:predicted dehydrogenase
MRQLQKLRVGIAGYGIVGKRRRHFIDLHPKFEVVAVCDRYFKSNGTLDDGLPCYKNYQDLFKHNLDVLFVCLTNDIAAEVTIAGLKHGAHVFCEKPPGRSVDDIAGVMAVEAKFPGLKLMYGFNHRYHDSIREAQRIVGSGELGSLLNIKGTYGKSKIISFESDWRTKRAVAGGGILLDQGIHMVDMMRMFAGEFADIHSFISNAHWNHDVEDNAYAIMRTNEGVVAMLHSSATQWRHRFHLELCLSKGAIILSGILSGSKSYGAETISVVYASPHDSGDPKEVKTRYNTDPSWEGEINVFANAIVNNEPIVSGSSEEAFKTMQLVYRIYCADSGWKSKFNLSANPREVAL